MTKTNLSRITVYHIKGGVGKTRIALNLSLELDFGIITNDEYSVIQTVLPAKRHKILKFNEALPAIPQNIPLIYDLGGYPDTRAIEAIQQSQFILTPILAHKEDLQIALDFIQEIQRYNPNIIIIINKTKGDDFKKAGAICRKFYPGLAVFQIKESKAMSLLVEQKTSIKELARSNKLHRRHYEKIDHQFDMLIKHMTINLKNLRHS